MELNNADATPSLWDGFLAALTNFGRDGVRSAQRALTGYDPETGEPVLQTERALTLLGGALPIGGAGRAATKRAPPAALLAGRQADGIERGLADGQVERLAGLLTEGVFERPATEMAAGAAGTLSYRMPAAGRGEWSPAGHLRPEALRIELAAGMDPTRRAHVLAHETGHAVDATAGFNASDIAPAVEKELQTISRAYRPGVWRDGATSYATDPAETIADALAMYLTDPATAKATGPAAAAWLRKMANSDERIRRHVIFNARAATPGLFGDFSNER